MVEYEDKKLIVIKVNEFADIPILCKKDFPNVLRKGACYVRPRRKPETTEIPSQVDMRDLLDLATEKKLRKFTYLSKLAEMQSVPSDKTEHSKEFEKQLKTFLD